MVPVYGDALDALIAAQARENGFILPVCGRGLSGAPSVGENSPTAETEVVRFRSANGTRHRQAYRQGTWHDGSGSLSN